MSFLVSQSSRWERESWMLYFNCLLAVIWLLVSLPRGAVWWFAVCDCGISWPYSLMFGFETTTSTSVDPLSILYSDFTSSFLLVPSQVKGTKSTPFNTHVWNTEDFFCRSFYLNLFYYIVLSMSCSLVVTCWPLGSPVCDNILCFVTFVYGDLSQVWYLIVLIPDLYLLPFF